MTQFDNPASRLHIILEEAYSHSKTENCLGVFTTVLKASDNEDLLSKLGKVMQLPWEAARLITLHYPHRAKGIEHWRKPLENGFVHLHLTGQFGTFSNHLSAGVIEQVGQLGDNAA